MPGGHAAVALDLVHRRPRPALDLVGEGLQVVRAAEGVDRPGHADLVGQDLLGAQRDQRRLLGGQPEGLVVAHGVHGLGAREHDRERLVGDAHDVVHRLDRGQRGAVAAREEAQLHRARILRPEALAHRVAPDAPGGPVLGDLLEEVAHRRDVEAEARGDDVDVDAAVHDRLEVGEAVGERDRHLLHGVAARLADVVPAHRDRVELGGLAGAPLEHVRRQPQGGPRREDVGLAGQVLLEDVVLDRAAQVGRGHALAAADRDVHRQQHRGGGVDRERRRHPLQRDAGRRSSPCRRASPPRRPPCRPRPAASGWSGSRPIWVGRSRATESPVWPRSSR